MTVVSKAPPNNAAEAQHFADAIMNSLDGPPYFVMVLVIDDPVQGENAHSYFSEWLYLFASTLPKLCIVEYDDVTGTRLEKLLYDAIAGWLDMPLDETIALLKYTEVAASTIEFAHRHAPYTFDGEQCNATTLAAPGAYLIAVG